MRKRMPQTWRVQRMRIRLLLAEALLADEIVIRVLNLRWRLSAAARGESVLPRPIDLWARSKKAKATHLISSSSTRLGSRGRHAACFPAPRPAD